MPFESDRTSTQTTYETVIGLEVHAQLLTKSKMFCGCNADYASAPPNTHVCPVCMGMPGVLPVINRQAIECAIMTALALNCSIAEFSRFDRKNYPYPDLMKGYQISQYDMPLSHRGWLEIETGGNTRKIGITRVHQEEDTARLTHRTDPGGEGYSLVDVNRAGVPLMEIVAEPDIRSPEEARQYLVKLRTILQYLGVSTGNMEEGSFRCDANISIRPTGTTKFLTKVEVKNMNSFKAVFRALEYEEQRQRKVLDAGERLVQETRGWVDDKGVTISQRSKEFAHDYRYFPEPDLPPMAISREWVEAIRQRLPELPDARRLRFMEQYGLPSYDAGLLTTSRAMADYFEAVVSAGEGARATPAKAKAVSNWLLGEFTRLLNAENIEIKDARIAPPRLSEMLCLVDAGTLSIPIAKRVFEEMFHSGKTASRVIEEQGLTQISATAELDAKIAEVVATNPKAIADFKAGKGSAIGFLMGQVMKATKGRANPAVIRELIEKRLSS